jgi:putative transposase
MSLSSYRFKLYPTKKQESLLFSQIFVCKNLYNKFLELNKENYNKTKKFYSCFDLNKLIKSLDSSTLNLKIVNSQVLQNVSKRVSKNIFSFLKRKKTDKSVGFPRFKSIKKSHGSFTFPSLSGWKLDPKTKTLNLNKIGCAVNVKLHREIIGKIKTCSINVNSLGEWYVSFSVDSPNQNQPLDLNKVKKKDLIGIDLGVSKFAVLSDDSEIQNPRFLREIEKKKNKISSQLSKARNKKDNKTFKKKIKVLRKINKKLHNRTENFLHQTSFCLINKTEYKVFGVEKLNVKNMLGKAPKVLSKNIQAVSMSKFLTMMKYKAEKAGKVVIFVSPNGTSQQCSKCLKNPTKRKDLSIRVHECEFCGTKLDRDLNASYNIKRLTQEKLNNFLKNKDSRAIEFFEDSKDSRIEAPTLLSQVGELSLTK